MSTHRSLSEAVSSIEEKAERKQRAEEIDDRVERADRVQSRINSKLADLTDAIQKLQFYRKILLEAFDGREPTGVRRALTDAEAVIEKDNDEMIATLRDGKPEQYRSEIDGVIDDVDEARRSVESRLDDQYWSEWNERIASARELQGILGSANDDFDTTIGWIQSLINQDMQNPDQSAASVVEQWDRAKDQWDEHQDLQGISEFQQTYGISDDTVDTIRTLSQGSTTLASVDVDTLEELKDIPELADAISLEI